MRRYAFIIAILGIFALLLILILSKPLPISSPSELSKFQDNQKLLIDGKVIKQTASTLYLNNNFSLICDSSCPQYLNKNISAIAIKDSFNDKTQLKILRIKFLTYANKPKKSLAGKPTLN